MSYPSPIPNYYDSRSGNDQPSEISHTSGKAIFSMIAGIISFFCCPGLASLAAIITGHMAKNEIRNSGGYVTGDGLATVGLIFGYINIALTLLGLFLTLLVITGAIAFPTICLPVINNFERY